MPPRKPPPTELARVLRRLRDGTGLSAKQAADAATPLLDKPLGQSTVSRFEQGRVVPSTAQIDALCQVYEASDDDREWLHAHARERDRRYRRVAAYRPQAARLQREYGEFEEDSTRVVTFTPTLVPGLLQTDGYLAAMGGRQMVGEQLGQWLAARRERRARLDEPGRTFEQILFAGALLWGVGDAAVMAEQIDHLIEVSRKPSVTLGVIPLAVDAGGLYVSNGFDLYERPGHPLRVIVGTTASVLVHDQPEDSAGDAPDDTAEYVALLDELRALAVWGDDARGTLANLRRWYV